MVLACLLVVVTFLAVDRATSQEYRKVQQRNGGPPSQHPIRVPTHATTRGPSNKPTSKFPTVTPTCPPTRKPSFSPSKKPTFSPSSKPTFSPSSKRTTAPSSIPTQKPSMVPLSSSKPSLVPTKSSPLPTSKLSTSPILSESPSTNPSTKTSMLPTVSNPSVTPSIVASSALTVQPASTDTQCTDYYPYTDGYTCAQQAGWGQCKQPWLQAPYCNFSCNRCNCMCNCPGDYYPYTDGYTCSQQAGWGKCSADFMQPPVCMHACGRCSDSSSVPSASPIPSPSPVPNHSTAPIPTVPTSSPSPITTAPPVAASSCGSGITSTNRLVVHNGKKTFLSGVNVAWGPIVSFGQDINYLDPSCTSSNCVNNRAYFTALFSDVSSNGGNSIRFWIHPDGGSLPVVNNDYTARIIAAPTSAQIASLQFLLNLGIHYNVLINFCLWSFDMVNDQGYGAPYGLWNRILTNPTNRNSYLVNWLTPMVQAASPYAQSSLLSFEVFNEPEGMTTKWGWTSCNSGSSDCAKVDIPTIQKFANLVASTIHNVNSAIKVTVGSWCYQASSNVEGATNIWSDANLIAAGGATNGVLDYYQIHFYNGFGNNWSPIANMMPFWQALDKPHVIGELPNDPYPYATTAYTAGSYFYQKLLQNCYSGAWGWVYCTQCGGSGEFDRTTYLANMKFMQATYSNLTNVNLGSFVVPSVSPVSIQPTISGPCTDNYPYTDGYTCAQQAGWGKCDQAFMAHPVCDHSCGRC